MPIDGEEVRRLDAEGKTPTEIARVLGCARSSVTYHLQRRTNGQAVAGTAPKANGNGHVPAQRESATAGSDEAVERILLDRWQRLPLPVRLAFLLDHRGD